MKIFIYRIYSNKCLGRLFKNLSFKGVFIQEKNLIERDVNLQIGSIVDIAFFFNIRQAIE